MNWIKVANGLPEFEQRVLVLIDNDKRVKNLIMIGQREMWKTEGQNWVIEDDENWPGDCVTHWTPLPEVPED
ncbi:MAG: DUF551 domain-containing protein [Verrucomicrobia bacterium]|nr:DUF551 domain-containing protein [Verrucomicrobiota bacterium]